MAQDTNLDFISVCICTYRRPEMVARALEGVTSQVTGSKFCFEIVVVDNDHRRSAEKTVRLFQSKSASSIIYDCEPEQNIALARNRAIRNAAGNLVAFIDDDEFPTEDWLQRLYAAIMKYNADGVLGPVIPFFPEGAPHWLKEGNICNRRRLPTGTQVSDRDTRTGNVLLKRGILSKDTDSFNPVFGLTGGEDQDFFRNQIKAGRVFVWCDEAEVFETVPTERWQVSFYLIRNSRMGTLFGEALQRTGSASLIPFMKNAFAVLVWLSAMLICLPFGKRVWMVPVLRFCYSGCCVLAFCGVSLVRRRS